MPTNLTSDRNRESMSKPKLRSRPLAATFIIFGGIIALLLGITLSVSLGAADIKLSSVWEAMFHYNPDIAHHLIIHDLRMPRVIGSAMVGAAFAVAGALMQGITRNPMADSGLLGLNAGAVFVMALCFAFYPGISFLMLIGFAFLGAAGGAGLVFGVSAFSRGGMNPVRLVLAGSAVTGLLLALSEGVALYFNIGQDLAFWFAGGVAGTNWEQLRLMTPWVGGALIIAILLSRSVTLLSLGEEVAVGLGQNTKLIKCITMFIVLVLAGSSVAVVGPVGFVGLIIPHLTRLLVGVDYRWIIPSSAVLGSLLVVLGDLAARMINPPYEAPLGALIAMIGVPFFLYLARKERREL